MFSSVQRVIHISILHSIRIFKTSFTGIIPKKRVTIMAQANFKDVSKINTTLDLTDPLKSYQSLMDNTMLNQEVDHSDEEMTELWDKICDSVREAMWKLLFDTKNPSKEQLEKAGALLKQHKSDACFQNPTAYNKWIYELRDEVLKREMFDFWRDQIVAKELGVAWARDSDMFDRFDDPEPVNFYKFAGSEAAWLKEEATKPSAPPLNLMTSGNEKSTEGPKALKKMTKDNAVEDYKHNMAAQDSIDPDDEKAYKKIFAEVREILWQILFSDPTLSEENAKKAAALLLAYKLDACFFSPYDYNEWIPKVRDELFKRKYFDFWKVICKDKMGLCWYKDSDYFDDTEDPKPMEFYKSGDELMKQHEKL